MDSATCDGSPPGAGQSLRHKSSPWEETDRAHSKPGTCEDEVGKATLEARGPVTRQRATPWPVAPEARELTSKAREERMPQAGTETGKNMAQCLPP